MKQNIYIKYVYIILVTAVITACSSSRKTVEAPIIGGLKSSDYVEKVIGMSPFWQSLSGKVVLNLSLEQGKSTKINATFRLKRDESIQLSVAPLLGIEIARLEISPDGILGLDRMNKNYVKVSFEEVSRWARTDLSFSILQSLFLNEFFIPGKPQVEVADADVFRISLVDGRALLETEDERHLTYSFFISPDQGLLQESRIGLSGTPYMLQWKYDAFRTLDGHAFPERMCLSVSGGNKPAILDMKFSRLNVGGDWEVHTKIPARYAQVKVEDLLKLLTSQ